MAVFTLIPFSAESTYKYTFSDSEKFIILQNSTNYYFSISSPGVYNYGFSDSSEVSVDNVVSLPIVRQSLILNDDEFYYNPVFFNNTSSSTNFIISIHFPFVYNIKGGDTFIIYSKHSLTPGAVYFLTNEGDRITCSLSALGISDYNLFPNYYSDFGTVYYYDYNSSSVSSSVINNTVFKYTCTIQGSDYYSVDSINFDSSRSNYSSPFYPFIRFGTLPDYYIFTTDSEDIGQILTDIGVLQGQLEDLNDKIDTVTGPPSQQQQAAIDQVENQLATEYDELQEQLDIIHSVEFPTELPTQDTSELENQAVVIDNYIGDLNLLNIFNIIVPAGCAGFLIYTVLRRF